MKYNKEIDALMTERFGRDRIIALATVDSGVPCVRYVNAYYENGAFYVITHALSGKMRQIAQCPAVAIAGDWFNAQGEGVNLGYFGKAENRSIADKLRQVFREWIDNGHNDFNDENTVILSVKLHSGVLFSHGTRYDVEF